MFMHRKNNDQKICLCQKEENELFHFSGFNFLASMRNVFKQDGKKPTQNLFQLNKLLRRNCSIYKIK